MGLLWKPILDNKRGRMYLVFWKLVMLVWQIYWPFTEQKIQTEAVLHEYKNTVNAHMTFMFMLSFISISLQSSSLINISGCICIYNFTWTWIEGMAFFLYETFLFICQSLPFLSLWSFVFSYSACVFTPQNISRIRHFSFNGPEKWIHTFVSCRINKQYVTMQLLSCKHQYIIRSLFTGSLIYT